MNRLGLTLFAAAVLVTPLCAQGTTAQADVPFDFVVGTTTIPAGKYFVTFQYEPARVQFASGSYRQIFLVDPASSRHNQPRRPALIFHRYGNQIFLSRLDDAWTSRGLPMSQVERELEKRATAAAPRPRGEIVLAMR
jgi:hypothetical protein